MFWLLFFLGVLIAGLISHILRLRAEITLANLHNAELESLLAELCDKEDT
jgi:hypothetical protein